MSTNDAPTVTVLDNPPAQPTHVPALSQEERDEIMGVKPKGNGSVPRTSVTVTIDGQDYVFGDLVARIARDTIEPIMAIQKVQVGGGAGLISSINLITDFLGRYHEATWDSSNRVLYHQGQMWTDRGRINEAPIMDILKAFHDVAEMLTDPFVVSGFLTRDPGQEERYQTFLKSMSTSS